MSKEGAGKRSLWRMRRKTKDMGAHGEVWTTADQSETGGRRSVKMRRKIMAKK